MKVIKFVLRFIKALFILFAITLPLEILGLVLVPLGLIFQRHYRLPTILKWFDNADVWLGRNSETYELVVNTGSFLEKYHWLALRNPINYFGYAVLGVKQDTLRSRVQIEGDIRVGDGAENVPGFLYQEFYDFDNNKDIYEYYYIHKWSATKCFRFRMGHKIGRTVLGDVSAIQYVFVIQPYKDYHGQ